MVVFHNIMYAPYEKGVLMQWKIVDDILKNYCGWFYSVFIVSLDLRILHSIQTYFLKESHSYSSYKIILANKQICLDF